MHTLFSSTCIIFAEDHRAAGALSDVRLEKEVHFHSNLYASKLSVDIENQDVRLDCNMFSDARLLCRWL